MDDPDRPYKIVLAGRHGVGKSTIFNELQNQSESADMNTVATGTGINGRKGREKWMVYMHSRGRDVTVRCIQLRMRRNFHANNTLLGGFPVWVCFGYLCLLSKFQVQLWDTGGMERQGQHNMTRSYFNKSSATILVCDRGDMDTLTDLEGWVTLALDYNADDIVFSLWVNNTDTDKCPFGDETVRNFADDKGIPRSLVFDVSSSSGDNLIDAFKKVVDAVHLAEVNPRRYREEFGMVDISRPEVAPKKWWSKCCGN